MAKADFDGIRFGHIGMFGQKMSIDESMKLNSYVNTNNFRFRFITC